jgi:hypothetical protein
MGLMPLPSTAVLIAFQSSLPGPPFGFAAVLIFQVGLVLVTAAVNSIPIFLSCAGTFVRPSHMACTKSSGASGDECLRSKKHSSFTLQIELPHTETEELPPANFSGAFSNTITFAFASLTAIAAASPAYPVPTTTTSVS